MAGTYYVRSGTPKRPVAQSVVWLSHTKFLSSKDRYLYSETVFVSCTWKQKPTISFLLCHFLVPGIMKQHLVLLHHSNNIAGSNLLVSRDLAVWRLHDIPECMGEIRLPITVLRQLVRFMCMWQIAYRIKRNVWFNVACRLMDFELLLCLTQN